MAASLHTPSNSFIILPSNTIYFCGWKKKAIPVTGRGENVK
jgi:hypothetical protein